MLDTVKLRSPYLSEDVARVIEKQMMTRCGFQNSTGEVEYELVTGSPEGSWDVRPHVNVRRKEIVTLEPVKVAAGESTSIDGRTCVERDCPPYVEVEGSVHKALLGHNVFGGPLDPIAACRFYTAHLGRILGVFLPDGLEWMYMKVDWAEVYDMGSFDAAKEYIHGLSFARYSRRRADRRGDGESMCFYGTTTSVKAYHKGPEFYAHDRRRVAGTMGEEIAVELQQRAHELVRLEVSIKGKKLKSDFKGVYPSVEKISHVYLEKAHDAEFSRVIREGNAEMETVRNAIEVQRRLCDVHGPNLGHRLYGTWVGLATIGESRVMEQMTRRTFYRHRKQIQEACVSWDGSDVIIKEHSAIPKGFCIGRNSPFRLTDEAPEVVSQLASYKVA